jgi:hypothetical protein
LETTKDTNNLFHAPCVGLETTNNLSEAFPVALDNEGVI